MNDLEFLYKGAWVDAYDTFGLKMNTSFVPNLFAPRPMKKVIENVSRMQHGKRVVVNDRKYETRDVTLNVVIWGDDKVSYRANRDKFLEYIESGMIALRIPSRSSEVFHLLYLDSSSYAEDYWGTYGSMAIKFNEPNPNDRVSHKPVDKV